MTYLVKKNKKGFTLVELLVAVAVFLTTIIFLSQIFINTLKLESIAYSMLIAENNVRNTIDSMARIIRMGKDFRTENDNKKIIFSYYDGKNLKNITYEFISITPEVNNIKLTKDGENIGLLFNPDIKVKAAKFYLVTNNQLPQTTVVIILKTETKIRGVEEPFVFNIETAITTRYFNI